MAPAVIPPEDTITIAPVFGAGQADFLNYIETHFFVRNVAGGIQVGGENVKISFYVAKDGSIEGFKYMLGSNILVANEIERIMINMPKWKPGYQNGKKKKTLMIYDLLVKEVADLPGIEVTLNSNNLEYTNQTKNLKWFIVASSVLILVTLWITSSIHSK